MNDPIAGPSTRPYFPPTLRLDEELYQPSNSSRASSPAGGPRYASRPPSRPPSRGQSRARSASVFSGINVDGRRYDERIRKKRYESVQRLKSAWELLLEKYGTVQVEDDDEIDLMTGEVVRNRGRLLELEPREFGQVSDGEYESEDDELGTAFDSDEDELGAWDERSGLDNQDEEEEPPPPPAVRWTVDDQADLDVFLRLEKERRKRAGEEGEEDGMEVWGPNEDDVPLRLPVRSRSVSRRPSEGTEEIPILGAATGDSDDELLAQTSDAEEATRVAYVPSGGEEDAEASRGRSRRRSAPAGQEVSRPDKDERRQTLPPPPHSLLASSLPPPRPPRDVSPSLPPINSHQHASLETEADIGPTLRDLFTPPIEVPVARRSLIAPVPQRGPFMFGSSVFAATREASKEQRERERAETKQRIAIERADEPEQPGGPLDPAAYHQRVMRSRNGVSLRFCKPCSLAGGERGERMYWCKGRHTASWCTFIDRTPGLEEEAQEQEKHMRAPRQCKRCKRVGGQRGAAAIYCRGRKKRELCPYDSDDTDAHVMLPQIKPPVVPTAPLPNVNVAKLDPERYHPDVHYTHNGTRVRQCLGCKLKGGLREKRAAWCRGRWRFKECTFLLDDPGKDGEELEMEEDEAREGEKVAPNHSRSTMAERDLAEPTRQAIVFRTVSPPAKYESALLRASLPAERSIHPLPMFPSATLPPPNLDGDRYYDSLAFLSTANGTVRRCKPCREAGGKRRETAMWCRGRVWTKYCSFRDGDGDEEFDEALMKPTTEQVVSTRRPSLRIPLAPPLGEGYYLDVRHSPGKTSFVKCQACAIGGEMREAKAIWCTGRKHARLCSFAKVDAAKAHESLVLDAQGAEADDPLAMDTDARPVLPMTLEQTLREDDENLFGIGLTFDGKRKRGSSAMSAQDDAIDPALVLDNIVDGGMDRVLYEEPISATHLQLYQTAEYSNDPLPRAGSLSLPPSSPPAPSPVDPAPTRPSISRPTPSPSVSLTRISQSPAVHAETHVHSSSLPPSSPIFEPTPRSRKAPLAFRPTPPSSISARSASVLSDAGSLSFPRRGILRRPSEIERPGSVHRLAKRTRFSLAPLSPVRQVHSDPVQPMVAMDIDHDDDELLLGPSTSPAYAGRARTIQDRAAAALEYSREISIRARDVGFNLSVHTGRLSSDMLAALAPALGDSGDRPPTLGSSLRHSVTNADDAATPVYSLPTPPPNHLPMCGNLAPAHSDSVGLSDKGKSKETMPPPPVPNGTPGRLPTPLSAEDEEDSDGGVITPINRRIRLSRSRSRSRSRAQSMSALRDPNSRTSSPAQPHPASTPRRRSKLEETLGIIAQTVDGESLEWGMDEDVGEDLGKMWREGSVVHYLE